MQSKLLNQTNALPVSVNEMKDFARIQSDQDDFLLEGLLKTASAWVEEATGKTLLNKQWLYTHNNNTLTLPYSPVVQIDEVKVGRKTLAQNEYTRIDHLGKTKLELPFSWNRRAVSVTYTAGFGTDPKDVPDALKQAIMSTVTYIYENRYPTMPGQNQAFQCAQPWIQYHRSYQMA